MDICLESRTAFLPRNDSGAGSFDDVQALRTSYRKYLHDEGACQPDFCSFWIAVPNIAYRQWLDREWLRYIGFRPARATASVKVEKGKLARASFGISYRTANGFWHDADTKAVLSFTPDEQCLNLSFKRHPNYEVTIWNITTLGGGRALKAAYAASASSQEKEHARKINLACAVRVPDCTLAELMPLAHADLKEDGHWRNENWDSINRNVDDCLKSQQKKKTDH